MKEVDKGYSEVQQFPAAERRFFYGYIVVAAAFVILMMMWSVLYSFGVFFKPLLTELGWSRAVTSGAFSLAMIMMGLMGIVMGKLTDRFGPRLVLTLCGILMGLGVLLMSQVSTVWQLYLFFGVIIGTGMGGAIVPLLTTVARWFVRRRSLMTGIVMAGAGSGALIAPPVASWLISIYDWRIFSIMLGGLVFVVLVLAAQFLKRDPTHVGQIPYGMAEGEGAGLESVAEGLSFKEAIHTRQFWILTVMFFSLGFYRLSILVHIVPHALDLGISITTAANILATLGGLSIVGRIVMGSTADKIGNRRIFIIGFVLQSLSLFWLVPATGTWMLFLFAAVFGFASGISASESPLVARLFGLDSHGMIFGVMGFSHTIGAAIGPFLTGYIFDISGSYQGAFLTSAAIGVIGLIFTVLLTPVKTNRVH